MGEEKECVEPWIYLKFVDSDVKQLMEYIYKAIDRTKKQIERKYERMEMSDEV